MHNSSRRQHWMHRDHILNVFFNNKKLGKIGFRFVLVEYIYVFIYLRFI
jgi:hypothetical protein